MSGQVVGSVRLIVPAQGRLNMPLTPEIPGYDVTGQLGTRLEPHELYSVSAISDRGVNFGGTTFRPSELREGNLIEGGNLHDPQARQADPPRCGVKSRAVQVAVAITVGVLAMVALIVAVDVKNEAQGILRMEQSDFGTFTGSLAPDEPVPPREPTGMPAFGEGDVAWRGQSCRFS